MNRVNISMVWLLTYGPDKRPLFTKKTVPGEGAVARCQKWLSNNEFVCVFYN